MRIHYALDEGHWVTEDGHRVTFSLSAIGYQIVIDPDNGLLIRFSIDDEEYHMCVSDTDNFMISIESISSDGYRPVAEIDIPHNHSLYQYFTKHVYKDGCHYPSLLHV